MPQRQDAESGEGESGRQKPVMENIAVIFRFGFTEICNMEVAELMDWNVRSIAHSKQNEG